MKDKLIRALECTPDNRRYRVNFKEGWILILSNFELVDESIYNRNDVVISDVIKIVFHNSKALSEKNKYEFYLGSVVSVYDLEKKIFIFKKERVQSPVSVIDLS